MSDLARMLEQTAERLFSEHSTPAVVVAAEAGTWPATLWQRLEETGLPVMLVPEEAGGAGGAWQEAGVVLRLAGRFAAPVPLAETLLASLLLARAGLPVPDGPLTIAPVVAGDLPTCQRSEGGWEINGNLHRVPWGRAAAGIVVLADHAGACLVARVDPATCEIAPGTNLAGEPRDTVTFDNINVGDAAAAPAPAGIDAGWLHSRGALLRAVQMTGALERVLDLSLEYAQVRRQFGQPIGHFQAIQHQLVELAEHVASARAACDLALAAAAAPDALFAIVAATTRVRAAAGPAATIAHQVHGAMGFTQEHQLQLSTRRLWAWRDEFGSEAYWATRLGQLALETGADRFWEMITAPHHSEEIPTG